MFTGSPTFWAALLPQPDAQSRAQAIATLFASGGTIDFLDASETLIRTISCGPWAVGTAVGSKYPIAPGAFTDAALGSGVPASAVFKSGAGTEVFRCSCGTAPANFYRLAANVAAGVPIIRGASAFLVSGPVQQSVDWPAIATPPTISGNPIAGSTLTVTPGAWTGNPDPAITGQWLRNGVAVEGAAELTYTIPADDSGGIYAYRETATNIVGTSTSVSNAIGPVTIPLLAWVAVPNPLELRQGETYRLSRHVIGGAPPYHSYVVKTGTLPSDVTLIPDTGDLVAAADATLNPGTSIEFEVQDQVPDQAGGVSPYIVGLQEVGVPLMAFPGDWPNDPDLTYQWMLADGSPIAGETSRTYVPQSEQLGKQIKFRVTDGVQFADSPPTAPIAPEYVQNNFPQNLLEDDGVYGPSRKWWNKELFLWWPAFAESYRQNKLTGSGSLHYVGEWTNSLGEPNATNDPYAEVTFHTGSTPTYIEFEATALVERWRADNRGAYLRQTGVGSTRTDGRLGAKPPEIHITTPRGTQVISGGYICTFVTTSDYPTDTRMQAVLSSGNIVLLHWRDLVVPEDMIGAKIRLNNTAKLGTLQDRDVTLRLYETNIPKIRAGAGSETPEYGLAAEFGEANLPSHPDVLPGRGGRGLAGDFRREHFLNAEDSGGLHAGNTSLMANDGDILWTIGRTSADFLPAADGSTYLRTKFVHGTGGQSGASIGSLQTVRWTTGRPVDGDTTYPLDPDTVQDEMYVRAFTLLEHDFWSTTDGIKWGLGFDLRLGWWNPASGGYWRQTRGNSGNKGTGKRFLGGQPGADSSTPVGRWEYQGHSIRGHLDYCRPSGTRYQRYRCFRTMCSHNGPYLHEGPYGSEETMTSLTTVIEKNKWFCMEWHIKLNSVTGPYDANGNGVGVADGILEGWVDGVKGFERTDLIWRVHPDLGINSYWIENMHGGVTPPRKGEVLHHAFNHFVCAKRYIGPKA